jgi:DNA repair protein RadC
VPSPLQEKTDCQSLRERARSDCGGTRNGGRKRPKKIHLQNLSVNTVGSKWEERMKLGSKNRTTVPIVSLRMVREQSVKYMPMTVPADITQTIKPLLADSAVERLVVVGLDTQNRPTVIHITTGSTNQCSGFPSTILKIMLLANATAMILVHNHPGDTMRASECDWSFTKKMRCAAKTVDIDLLDSIIVNADCSDQISMRTNARW